MQNICNHKNQKKKESWSNRTKSYKLNSDINTKEKHVDFDLRFNQF